MSVVMKQHAGSVTLCGLNADDNVILEEEAMDQQTKDAIGAILAQQGVLGTKLDAFQASTDYLIKIAQNLAARVTALEAGK